MTEYVTVRVIRGNGKGYRQYERLAVPESAPQRDLWAEWIEGMPLEDVHRALRARGWSDVDLERFTDRVMEMLDELD